MIYLLFSEHNYSKIRVCFIVLPPSTKSAIRLTGTRFQKIVGRYFLSG